MNQTRTLSKGDLVKVYQKHLTQEDLEGYARLVKDLKHGDDEMGYRWEVCFIGPRGHAEAATYERWVHARDIQRSTGSIGGPNHGWERRTIVITNQS